MMDYKYRKMCCNKCRDYEESDMNGWRCDTCSSPADTYTEWCFEERCKELNNGFDIITEWRTRKKQHIACLETIAFDFQHFSRHDETHSINILESIEMLLGKKRIKLLSAGDLWMLLECAYMHDIGMSLSYQEIIDLWENDEIFHEYIESAIVGENIDARKAAEYYEIISNKLHEINNSNRDKSCLEMIFPKSWPVELAKSISLLVTEYIRSHHAELVWKRKTMVDVNRDSIIPDRLYHAMYTACDLHGKNFEEILEKLKPCCKGFGNTKIHPRFAAAMLRIGDMLDMDNNRFNPRAIEHYGKLPYVSMLHLEKHKAITHIAICESGIEAEAVSKDTEVCNVINDWFDGINKETKDLICYWNEIVPHELKGCLLQKSECSVFLESEKGEKNHYISKSELSFEVNKKKLIDVLIGNNIYSNSMDFIREYLQNALDAVKMQLWFDLKDKKYRFNEDLNHNVNIDDLTPFDIGKKIYDDYEIIIGIDLDMKAGKVKLTFKDHGIGMEKECVDALAKIGTGWRGRNRYSSEINRMPKWLRPTGGFGIGIQSAFMVTEQVNITTRDECSEKGCRLTLNSPKKRGTVQKKEGIICDRGTKVEVEFDIEKIFESNYKYRQIKEEMNRGNIEKGTWAESLITQFTASDYFNENKIMDYIVDFMEKYVKVMLPCSFIPVRIDYKKNKLSEDVQIRNKNILFEEKLADKICSKKISLEETQYLCILYKEKLNTTSIIEMKTVPLHLIIWDEKQCIAYYLHFDWNNDSRVENICFKNILVKDEILLNHKWNKHFKVIVDYMGFNAEEILKIHRDKFNDKFTNLYKNEVYDIVYNLYFEMIDSVQGDALINTDYDQEKNTLKMLLLRMMYAKDSYKKLPKFVIKDDVIGKKMEWNKGMLLEGDIQRLEVYKVLKNLESIMLENKGAIVVELNRDVEDKKNTNVISQKNTKIWYQMFCEEGIKEKKVEIYNEMYEEYLWKPEEEQDDLTIEEQAWITEEVEKKYLEFCEAEKRFDKMFIPLDILFDNDMIVIIGEYAELLLNLPDTEIHTFQIASCSSKYAYITKKQKKAEKHGQQFYQDSFYKAKAPGARYIAKNVEKELFPNLQVERVPYGEMEGIEKPFIISPIDYEAYSEIVKLKLSKMQAAQRRESVISYNEQEDSISRRVPYNSFQKCVVDTSSYPLLVDYVYNQQYSRRKAGEGISKTEIRRDYEKYIRHIYDAVIDKE